MTKLIHQLNQFILLSTTILVLSLFASCDREPDDLGLEVLPDEENLILNIDSSAQVFATTVKLDPINTFTPDSGFAYTPSSGSPYIPTKLLADYQDPFWGHSKSSLLLSFLPDSFKYNLNDKVIDSVVFYLQYDSVYGDKNTNVTFSVFELNKSLSYKQDYYSNINESDYKGSLLTSKVIQFKDTVVKIKIEDSNFINRLKTLPADAQTDFFKYHEYFKGFYIDIQSQTSPGVIAVVKPLTYWSYTNLVFHYRNTAQDTVKQRFDFNVIKGSVHVNKFSHNYASTPIETVLQTNTLGQKITYVQGMGGLGTRISIPDLSKWKTEAPVSINKAELVIPVDQTNLAAIPESNYPRRLSIKAINNSTGALELIEYGFGQTFINGAYDAKRKAYIFNIAKHIQRIANSKFNLPLVENNDLLILADGYKAGLSYNFNTVALDFSKGAKLYIIYSKQ